MLSLESLRELNLLRTTPSSSSRLSRALERLRLGTSAQSSSPSSTLSDTFELSSDVAVARAQLTESIRVGSMLNIALSGVRSQESLLAAARSRAVQASLSSTSSSERASLQKEITAILSDFDNIVTTTQFDSDLLLDGSLGEQTYSLRGESFEGISVQFVSTSAANLGQLAEITGSPVSTTALIEGELVINGIAVDAASAGDDIHSSGNNAVSAISTAAAINRANAGVQASAGPTTVELGSVSAGSFFAGALTINGVDIGPVTVMDRDADGALAQAINSQSSSTGVVASINALGELRLSAEDGRNIITAGADTDGTGVIETQPGSSITHTGVIILSSSSDISISGSNPESAGLGGTSVVPNSSESLATIDVASREGALMALRQIDNSRDQLRTFRTVIDTASMEVLGAAQSLATPVPVDTALDRGVHATVAQEAARLSAEIFVQRAQTSIFAQANVSSQYVVQLLTALTTVS